MCSRRRPRRPAVPSVRNRNHSLRARNRLPRGSPMSIRSVPPSELRRYSGFTASERRISPASRYRKMLQSIGVDIHLWGFSTIESARSHPSNSLLFSGREAAGPAYAASTCIHTPSRSHTSAMADTGSTLVVEVVPIVAHTMTGVRPAARSSVMARSSSSGIMRNRSSTGMRRRLSSPSPAATVALSSELWAWSDMYTTHPPRSSLPARP